MDFNQLILEKLHSLFIGNGFKIKERLKNIVRYESKILHVSLVHNDRENSNTFWLGLKSSNDFIEIDNQVMKDFFNSDLQIKDLPPEDFVNNVFAFFTNEGKEVLEESQSLLMELEKFDQLRSELYTSKLIEEQTLGAANKAWKEKDYTEFIRYLKKVNKRSLTASLKLKYKIAKKKIGREKDCN